VNGDEPPRKGSSTTLIVVIGAAIALGLLEIVAIQKFGRRPAPPAPPAAQGQEKPSPPPASSTPAR
jgi:hypothetical protein